jgi:hypothetical protein
MKGKIVNELQKLKTPSRLRTRFEVGFHVWKEVMKYKGLVLGNHISLNKVVVQQGWAHHHNLQSS